MTRATDTERGTPQPFAPLVIKDRTEAWRVMDTIRTTPRMGDAWATFSGYEEGYIIEWWPKGGRPANAYVMPDGTAYDVQRQMTVKRGLPV